MHEGRRVVQLVKGGGPGVRGPGPAAPCPSDKRCTLSRGHAHSDFLPRSAPHIAPQSGSSLTRLRPVCVASCRTGPRARVRQLQPDGGVLHGAGGGGGGGAGGGVHSGGRRAGGACGRRCDTSMRVMMNGPVVRQRRSAAPALAQTTAAVCAHMTWCRCSRPT